jgi:thiamine-phosphate pyrophosphorylase
MLPIPLPSRGLYVITDDTLIGGDRLVPAVAQAIQGGAVLVQYRSKSDDRARRHWEALDLLTLCRPLGVPLLINDDVELAAEIGADGAHIGGTDMPIAEARATLGADKILGVSCYNRAALAQEAAAAGADYIAFGRFFTSQSKPNAVQAEFGLFEESRTLKIPRCAIGGITPENAPALLEAGADLLAVIGGVFAEPNIRAAAQRYTDLFV